MPDRQSKKDDDLQDHGAGRRQRTGLGNRNGARPLKAEFSGPPIEIRYRNALRDTAGNEAHAATFIRQRLILLDDELRRDADEHARILAHELFHFTWTRIGNRRRLEWEGILALEIASGVRGDAGWSGEWRKERLRTADIRGRTRAWREYCCEAFCDTAAVWLTGSLGESTLRAGALKARIAWLRAGFEGRALPV